MMRTLAFDLDDTLYDEHHYVLSGMAAVAKVFARELKVSVAALEDLLETLLLEGGRKKIFNRAFNHLDRPVDTLLIEAMVKAYRHHTPVVQLYAGVSDMLAVLSENYRLVLVTDGLPLMQRNKVAALEIGHWFDRIVYCWEHNVPKPDATGYRLAIGEQALSKGAVIIGDHPLNDGEPAKILGLPFIRIKSPRFAALPGGDIELQSVTQLPEKLELVCQ